MMNARQCILLGGVFLAGCLAPVAWGMTLAYWQLDGPSDTADAVNNDGWYYDLTTFGSLITVNAPQADPIPNPDQSVWRSGSGNATDNPLAVGFPGSAGYYLNNAGVFAFRRAVGFTLEAWIKPNAAAGTIASTRHLNSNWWGWWLAVTAGGNQLQFYVQTGAADTASVSTSITPGQWIHVATVWDPQTGAQGELRLYVDGVLKNSAPGNPNWASSGGGAFSIGMRYSTAGWGDNGFQGAIDEVRFVDEPLAPEFFLNGSTPLPQPCGSRYLASDFNRDCYVDINDLALLASHWLSCNDPANPDCD